MSRLWGVLLLSGCLFLSSAGMALAVSAFPLKSPSDTGTITSDEYDQSGYVDYAGMNLYVRGYDACIALPSSNAYNSTYQQYDVQNCVPIQTPWLSISPLQTQGWAVYCPSSAPYSWQDGPGGDVQQWSTDSDVQAMVSNLGHNSYGPSPVAKTDYFTINWGVHTHYWLYTVGCSTVPWPPAAPEPYCCGQGASAVPNFGGASAADVARQAKAAPRPTALMAKGPAFSRRTIKPGYYSVTREEDLLPSRTVRMTLSCQRGYRLQLARHGIGYYTRTIPTAKDGAVKDTQKRLAGRPGVALILQTNKRVKKGVVRAQLEIDCSKPGVSPPQATNPLSSLFPGV